MIKNVCRLVLLFSFYIQVADAQSGDSSTNFGVYSQFTFVPGDRLIFYDDFSQESIGDFPSGWGTNGSGEIVTSNKYPGKWLSLKRRAGYMPDFKKALPENYTIEFDIVTNGYTQSNGRSKLHVAFLPKKSFTTGSAGSSGYFTFTFGEKNFPIDMANFGSEATNKISNRLDIPYPVNGRMHISMSVKKRRLTVWIDQEKVIDAPSLLQGKLGDYFTLEVLDVLPEKGHTVLLGNYRIAEITKDVSNLLNDGKFSTTAIYFNTNSATIKPESYAIIKSVGEALKSKPNAIFQIIGHTDGDGEAAYNMDLSKRRAEAVKAILVSQFGVDDSKLIAIGKGESEPVDNNNTTSGKANNRRVEFIKQ